MASFSFSLFLSLSTAQCGWLSCRVLHNSQCRLVASSPVTFNVLRFAAVLLVISGGPRAGRASGTNWCATDVFISILVFALCRLLFVAQSFTGFIITLWLHTQLTDSYTSGRWFRYLGLLLCHLPCVPVFLNHRQRHLLAVSVAAAPFHSQSLWAKLILYCPLFEIWNVISQLGCNK